MNTKKVLLSYTWLSCPDNKTVGSTSAAGSFRSVQYHILFVSTPPNGGFLTLQEFNRKSCEIFLWHSYFKKIICNLLSTHKLSRFSSHSSMYTSIVVGLSWYLCQRSQLAGLNSGYLIRKYSMFYTEGPAFMYINWITGICTSIFLLNTQLLLKFQPIAVNPIFTWFFIQSVPKP